VLPLACDPGNQHRRRVWEAWDANGRCGRWSALHARGIPIRALPNLGDFELYRLPEPVQHVQQQIAGQPRGIVKNVLVDPEDNPERLPPISPFRDESSQRGMTAV